ncbi:hypothetical protein [Mycobacterium sp. 236(2023)]|uniref:hypothetical protein n=1 Tax=Mycobacterium sp. 236(2023) TaxID=3038163 RepID=UPI002414D94F|nr:hypothetical protein [Mycobacterium sp. 236(2023)]MDG4669389.1 hypothetical protein [Mycobacterium sp. 236(2023)]
MAILNNELNDFHSAYGISTPTDKRWKPMAAAYLPTETDGDQPAAGDASRGRGSKHRLMVLTSETRDTVASAGGFIFDRAAAGWDVAVHLPDHVDDRAFRILGVRTVVLQRDIDRTSQADCIAIAGSLYDTDRKTRRLFQMAARKGGTEVALWGAHWPRDLEPGVGIVEHNLSLAALAFKAAAMKAVGLEMPCTQKEAFYSGSHRIDIAAPLLAPA